MSTYGKVDAKEWAKHSLRGQWTTLVTPFTSEDQVDEEGLRSNMRHIRQLGTSGCGCTWGMGEFWSLTGDERRRVYDVVADESGGDWPIAAHVTHTSIKETLALADHAAAIGFDLLIVASPYFVTKTHQQVLEYVRSLAEGTDLAIMYYNSPQFGIVLNAHQLEEMCDIPNVVGVKEASFNRDISVDTHLLIGDKVVISTPDEWILFEGKRLGFQQQVMFANTSDWRFDSPGQNYYVQFINNATNGNLDEDCYDTRIRPTKELSDRWWQRTVKQFNGVLPVALCKYWGELMGMAAGHVRQPLSNLPADHKRELMLELYSVMGKNVIMAGESK